MKCHLLDRSISDCERICRPLFESKFTVIRVSISICHPIVRLGMVNISLFGRWVSNHPQSWTKFRDFRDFCPFLLAFIAFALLAELTFLPSECIVMKRTFLAVNHALHNCYFKTWLFSYRVMWRDVVEINLMHQSGKTGPDNISNSSEEKLSKLVFNPSCDPDWVTWKTEK